MRLWLAIKCFFLVLFARRLPADAALLLPAEALKGRALPPQEAEVVAESPPSIGGVPELDSTQPMTAPMLKPVDGNGAAVQLLAILQREGRLLDFLQEEVDAYSDAQIGAAVRDIHRGCKRALAEHMPLEPVLREKENAQVRVDAGFESVAHPARRQRRRQSAVHRRASPSRLAHRQGAAAVAGARDQSVGGGARRSGAAVSARFVVGIDLGTTNSAVAFVDSAAPSPSIEMFAVAQLIAPGVVEPRPTQPSFLYLPADAEMKPEQLALPWGQERGNYIVGELARNHGWQVPARLVSSAKSWLSHAGVDRLSADPALAGAGRGAEGLAGRGLGALSVAHRAARGTTRIPTRRWPSRTCC